MPPSTTSINKPQHKTFGSSKRLPKCRIAKPVSKAPRLREKPDQKEVFSLWASEKKIGENTTNSITSLKIVRFHPFEFPEIRQASLKN